MTALPLLLALLAHPVPPFVPAPAPAVEPRPTAGPLAAEVAQFPPRAVAEAYAAAAAQHCRWLDDNACLNTDRAWWPEYHRRAEHARDCWRALAEAANPDAADCWRESNLLLLRWALTEDAYAAGRMPLPLPCWGTYVAD